MEQCIYNIGVEATIDVIGGKWKPLILCHLKKGTMRTGQLRRVIPNITQKVLTQQLRELEASGIVNRKIYEQVPPKVEYSLTDYGKTLNNLLYELCKWGEEDICRRREKGESILLLDEKPEIPEVQAN
ncbi:winged helix-turn-helix transcriptional regulator [Companilactobacillus sp.]|uniref:winged helix-turn-helix transcriptional regulator n=1 Tax=Companilactobacillus sp. TaxID=2767905 RepID=UPI0025BE5644|nr:winged helix-turn-helix transcriptional regulator [Companilactobacillus sp.]MCH4008987.1 winged helix-turn-helix transcriptional regulator [Companilactobacillus sp.]MCH4050834.1 winged helix-turn-helix transcriptional regulator [Companilactobacillus sp.]MCH4076930.1 winged helix-turn-helix transcriptional regulator [Companilactobacillus sp.]MCH4125505.1 winged helix-turn-helix transcriptional regulator [Companilactobacillus sp.]MCI1311214.1 winged helix-turn-helix transcriptional regulator 